MRGPCREQRLRWVVHNPHHISSSPIWQVVEPLLEVLVPENDRPPLGGGWHLLMHLLASTQGHGHAVVSVLKRTQLAQSGRGSRAPIILALPKQLSFSAFLPSRYLLLWY